MPHDLGPQSRWIALSIQGDIGPLTFYTSQRNKLVAFLRAPPLHPPTPTQEVFRERFRQAAAKWRAASPVTRALWKEAAERCNLGITGYDLWTWWCNAPQPDALRTIERQAGFTLPLPP